MVGETISHYHVLRKLGGGGMGVVYAAEDLHLHRQVALKFLTARLATAPQALARFEREALAASACNHPNICTIHDIDRHEGAPFIVMELVDGVSLRDHMAHAMPLPALLRLGIQLADALEAAHGAGVVHRDLTPANVLITRRGDAKILDFGISKLLADQTSETETNVSTEAPEAPLTAAGYALGTPGYASPEQTLGLSADARSDLFSLGVLLYQMATGRRPFDGATPALVSDAVVHETPIPPCRLNPQVPTSLAAVIEKALEKDPNLRHQSAADLKADLRRLKRDLDTASGGQSAAMGGASLSPSPSTPTPLSPPATPNATPVPVEPPPPRWWRRHAPLLAAVLVALVGTMSYFLVRGARAPSDSPAGITSRTVTTGLGNDVDPAVSPDGTRIAYAVDHPKGTAIWMVDAQGVSSTPWKAGAGSYRHPAWSRDGNRIYFETDVDGWSAICVAEALNSDAMTVLIPGASEPALSPDGTRLAFVSTGGRAASHRIAVAPLADVRAVRVVSNDSEGQWDHSSPAWSPDGKEICYNAWDGLWVVAAAGGNARQLTHSDSTDDEPAWSPTGYIYFSSKRDGQWQLWRVRSSGGEPARFTVGLGVEQSPSLSPDGRLLAYSTTRYTHNVVIRDLATGAETPLSGEDDRSLPAMAPDGRAVYFTMRSPDRQTLWRQPLAAGVPSGPPRRLLAAPAAGEATSTESQPACSPDGKRVAFLRIQREPRSGNGPERWSRTLWTVPAEGGVAIRLSGPSGVDDYLPAWSSDGTRLAFVSERGGGRHVWIQAVEDGEARGAATRLTAESDGEMGPSWAPDGSMVAFAVGDGPEVGVAAVGSPGKPRIVTSGAQASSVRWIAPGSLLVSGFWGGRSLSLRGIDPSTGKSLAGFQPIDLGPTGASSVFDVSADRRYLALTRGTRHGGRIGVLATASGRF